MPLDLFGNPLLAAEREVETVDIADLESPTSMLRPKRDVRRSMLDLRRQQSAEQVLTGLTLENELYGFTKGQFSMLDLLRACVAKTGPAHLTLSTWTAARKEILVIDELLKSGQLTGGRWLIDRSFVTRDREAAHQIRKTFGTEAIRIANVHAKFFMFQNHTWKLVCRTSMNLNMNPRMEDFTLAHDPEVAAFLQAIMDEIWQKQRRGLGIGKRAELDM